MIGWNGRSATAAILVLAAGLAGYLTDSAVLVWTAFLPAVWLAFAAPDKAIELLLVTTPCFPAIRLASDSLNAQAVSTKGLFFSIDDPLIAALLIAWGWRLLRRDKPVRFFPPAIVGLMALYPLVGLVNFARLSTDQLLLSFLYYFKWCEYAMLIFLIPQLLRPRQARSLGVALRRPVIAALALSTLFAAYEFTESLRTGTYTATAHFPRASSFFGTLDPAHYGGSEDPVNFGVYAMLAGSVLLAWAMTQGKMRSWFGAGLAAVSLLLCASRAPVLAAAVAYQKIHKTKSSRLLLALSATALTLGLSLALIPGIWSTITERFAAATNWSGGRESSAMDRWVIAVNSPVFEVDQYWLSGHGFSTYRFIAAEHLVGITNGVSRSLYNFPLTLWYDAGPIGLLLWGIALFQLNRKLNSIVKSSPDMAIRSLALGVRGALWGMVVASMFGEVPYHWRLNGYFSMMAGICLAAHLHAAALYRRDRP